ncbi:MAG: UvrD-helicase domain-containing protein, partial [Deltaproteobacteria bacterium]|nr:UvrD-helicase domain-containing protein [Deltaproteobacteria bacterium]
MTSVKKKIPSDQKARQAALDPRRSFVVQAPAGSGKTELLIRRVLVLLTTVDDPEQIVAITFTRKAAAELRQRILEALVFGGEAEPDPDDVFRRELWRLAHAARAHDEARGWELLASPGRLGIQTIDSLCASLARRLPILSSLGGLTEVTDDPEALWREAARGTLAALESDADPALVGALEALYAHLDGQWQRLEELLVVQLGRRDQWLRLVIQNDDEAAFRLVLEGALGDVIRMHLHALRAAAPDFVAETLPSLARGAAAVLCDAGVSSEIASLAALSVLPGEEIGDVAAWRALATLLLTGQGALRKTVNKNGGFLPKTDAKEGALKLLARLVDAPRFVALLGEVAGLPPPCYTEAQWQILGALRRVLIRAAAELRVVFAEHHVVDFIAVAQAAIDALGPEGAPTDLALALDYRLAHLLVDEYQDTSFTQLALLEGLTAGWEPDDGRTLFLVGDPMQSIYRFREAEVGLFLQAQARGVGHLRLESLVLQENFRSREGVVSWVNDTFAEVLPNRDDIDKGAVSYSASSPFRSAGSSRAVTVHPFVLPADKDEVDTEIAYEAEAQAIAKLVAASLAAVSSPDAAPTVAILGRARTHLWRVAAALQATGVVYQAVDVDPLATRPAVSDLLALTRALVHEGDRLAWLSLLRAPWCGLELSELLVVAEAANSQTLWSRLNEPSVCEALSPRGQAAAARIVEVLAPALADRRRRPLRRWVEGIWYALGGPATVGAAGVAEAVAFFGLLEAAEEGGSLVATGALEEAVAKL